MSNIISLDINNQKLIEISKDNGLKSIIIIYDEGYQPIIEFREILINEVGFKLEKEFGITDMTQIFTYKNKEYILKYDSDEDVILLEANIENEIELNFYRSLAAYLKSKHQKKNKSL